VLAAYIERKLSSDEQSTWDTHVGACTRCQMTVAAVVRSDGPRRPLAEATRHPLAFWRWAVPAAAAATALGLWLMVEPPAAVQPAPETGDDKSAMLERAARLPETPRQPEVEPGQAEAKAETRSRAANQALKRQASDEDPKFEGLPPSPDTAVPTAASETTAPAAEAPPVPPLPARDEPAATASGRRDTAQESTEGLSAHARVASDRLTVIGPVEIRSPDPLVRWRVTGAFVERSTDGGSTWDGQTLDPSIAILAGSAPSSSVAWLAGARGRVYRSVDGVVWDRVTVPTDETLVSIEARSRDDATVTTSEGRRFSTTDGGATWVRR
jgi:hypothetical protein